MSKPEFDKLYSDCLAEIDELKAENEKLKRLWSLEEDATAGLYRNLIFERDTLAKQNEIYKAALTEIANRDFRGNRPVEAGIAFRALADAENVNNGVDNMLITEQQKVGAK